MRRRLFRVHGSYLLGVGTLVIIVFYLTSTSRVSRDNVIVKNEIYEKVNDRTESVPDLNGYIREAEMENSQRLQRVQQVCHRYNLGLYKHSAEPPKFKQPPTPQYSVFYIDKEHKLTWCPIYKAASTTWMYNLCLLAGYSEEYMAGNHKQINQLARDAFPELDRTEAEQAFLNTLKLLVVRHPFERLLSAYRDKLENARIGAEHGTAHFYAKYGSRIVAKYRPGGNKTRTQSVLKPGQFLWDPELPKPAGFEPTFKEFVRTTTLLLRYNTMLSDSANVLEKHAASVYRVQQLFYPEDSGNRFLRNVNPPDYMEPFIGTPYLIDLDVVYSDDHWIPFYLFCTPCLINYDIIVKVETMLRDQVYVIQAAGLQGLIRPRWRHKTYSEEREETSKRYFSQLTKQEVKRLYEKYQLDFELFDYKVDDYLKYASGE